MSVVPFIPADARRLFDRLDQASGNRDAVVAAVVSSKEVYGEGLVTKWVDAILRVRPDIAGLSNFAGEARAPAQHPQLRTRNVLEFSRPATSEVPAATVASPAPAQPAVAPREPGPLSYDQNRALLKTDGHVHFTAMQKVVDASPDKTFTAAQVMEIGHHGSALRTMLQRMVHGVNDHNAPLAAVKEASDFLSRMSASPNPSTRTVRLAADAAEAYKALCKGFDIRLG